jgi:hypothetical protein
MKRQLKKELNWADFHSQAKLITKEGFTNSKKGYQEVEKNLLKVHLIKEKD